MSEIVYTLPSAIEKTLDELLKLLPEVEERLATYGRNSHLGSPSEVTWVKLEKVMDKLERLGLVNR